MTPKGKLIIIGGAVDKGSFTESNFEDQVEKNLNFFEKGILRRIIDESKKGIDSRIEIIPTASKIPDIVGQEYMKAFHFQHQEIETLSYILGQLPPKFRILLAKNI
ncbi:MAG: hypothetical protein ACOVNZ_09320 [Crocinitomicaceae bacterium]